jgi:hypothetical protein
VDLPQPEAPLINKHSPMRTASETLRTLGADWPW